MKSRKKTLFTALMLAIIMTFSQSVAFADTAAFPQDKGSFDFPGNYEAPELVIDGKANDPEWSGKQVLATFGNSVNGGGAATMKIHRGDKALFFFFDVVDKNLLTHGNSNSDDVNKSDSIEVYINDMASMDSSTGYQINLAIHGKTRILKQTNKMTSTWTQGWGGWNGLVDYEYELKGTLNNVEDVDTGYSLELMVPYSQINIDKNSTIAIALGRGDKWDNAGSITQTHHDWFGWEYASAVVDPQIPTSYVCLKPDGTLISQDSIPKPNATIGGTITDNNTGEILSGVIIKDGGVDVATTGADGYYVINGVNPELNRILTLHKDGYFDSEIIVTRAELRAVDGGIVTKDAKMLNIATADKSNIKGTVKNIFDGNVSDVVIGVRNTTLTATTDSNGAFTIPNAPISGGITLSISKSGYVTEEIVLDEEDCIKDGDTQLGELNLSLSYKANVGVLGGGSNRDAWTVKSTRTLTGIRFYFETVTKFEASTVNDESESIIIYAHSGDMPTANKAFSLQFFANGNIGYDKTVDDSWARPATTDVKLDIVGANEDSGAKVTVEIPYTIFKEYNDSFVSSDVFGFSLGTMSYGTDGRKWDGFGFGTYVNPTTFTEYVRVDRNNNMYRAEDNTTQVILSGTITGTSDTKVSGAIVSVGGVNATTNANGEYTMTIPKPIENINMTIKATGYESKAEQVRPEMYSTLDSATLNSTLTQRLNTIKGRVKDVNGNALQGVSIELSANSSVIKTGETDADGYYSIADVPAFYAITLIAKLADYNNASKSITVNTQNAAASSGDIVLDDIIMATDILSISGTLQNLFEEKVEGATITVVDQDVEPVLSDANGAFTIDNVGLGNLKIVIEREGYETEIIHKAMGDLTADAVNPLGTIDMRLKYASMGVFGALNDNFAHFRGYITRTTTAFEFYFVSEFDRFVQGANIELFIDTKGTNIFDQRTNGDYLFILRENNVIQIVDWGTDPKNEAPTTGMTLDIVRDDGKTYVTFMLPYAFFGQKTGGDYAVDKEEVVGVSIGQIAKDSGGWDGWGYNFAGQTANGVAFVDPNWTEDYIRISKENILYSATTNNAPDFDAPIRFGTACEGGGNALDLADSFYANATRDANGITFSFHTYGNFSTNGEEPEMVLIYLDLDGVEAGDWARNTEDPLFKVTSDGKVYYKKGWAWWPLSEGTQMPNDVVITREHGKTSFSLTLSYEFLGIEADTVIGFAMREASNNAIDNMLYEPWFDCFFNPNQNVATSSASRWAGFNFVQANGLDAANQAEFIKMAADGTLSK